MTLEQLKETPWYRERPEVVQQAIDKLPPIQLYRFKNSGKQCQIFSFEEPNSGKLEDVTVCVIKTGKGGAMGDAGFGMMDEGGKVFGLKLEDLEPWTDD